MSRGGMPEERSFGVVAEKIALAVLRGYVIGVTIGIVFGCAVVWFAIAILNR